MPIWSVGPQAMREKYTYLDITFGVIVLWLMVAAAAFLTVSLFNPGFGHVCG